MFLFFFLFHLAPSSPSLLLDCLPTLLFKLFHSVVSHFSSNIFVYIFKHYYLCHLSALLFSCFLALLFILFQHLIFSYISVMLFTLSLLVSWHLLLSDPLTLLFNALLTLLFNGHLMLLLGGLSTLVI
jgi:hypothetical protein